MSSVRLAATLAACLLASLAPVRAAVPDIRQFTATNVKTLTLSSYITQENQTELKKIQGDIALAFRLHRGTMQYLQPDRLRVESTIPMLGSGYYVINGDRKETVGPFYHRVQDITGAPGKKQTLLDFGLVPPELMNEWNATFLRKEGGDYVFRFQPKQAGETFSDVVWIDPVTHVTVKRLNYDRDGKLVKWFLYKSAAQAAPGIYVPMQVELYNTENHLAGVTVYQNVKVNAPLNPSLFNF